jgi:uncharacterized protein
MILCGNKTNAIRTLSGKYFDLADPMADDIVFADIAAGLSNTCRFGGQVKRFYSVAEHSLHCSQFAFYEGVRLETTRALFCHDFAEAYIGDLVKPLKVMLGEINGIERGIAAVIEERFEVNLSDPLIKEIDLAMLIAERDQLFERDGVEWQGERLARKIHVELACWSPEQAFSQFSQWAREIGLPGLE